MASRCFYSLDGKNKLGPVPFEELRNLAAAGTLKPNHMVLPENTGRWQPASTMPNLFAPVAPVPSWLESVAPPPRPAVAPVRPIQAPAPPPPAPPPPPPPAPEPRPKSTPAAPARRSAGDVVMTCLLAPVVACKEIGRRLSLFGLRRKLRNQQREEQRFLGQLGGGLLSVGATIPGAEPLAKEFRSLNEQRVAAEQGGNKPETSQLNEQIQHLSVRYGQSALNSKTNFTGRPESQPRWEKLRQGMKATEGTIAQRERAWAATPRSVRLQAAAGMAVLGLLVGLAGAVGWEVMKPSAKSEPVLTQVPPADPEKDKTKKEEPPKLVRKDMKELFPQLAPSVPLVRALEVGLGSGFLVKHDNRYFVVTNRHVIENSRKGIAIDFFEKNGKTRLTIPASQTSVVAIHRSADLALIDVQKASADIEKHKVNPVPLLPVADELEVGEDVFAIGHPGAGEGVLTLTTTPGKVSGVGRPHPDKERKEDALYVQTTAAVNPGNSGGPLFDYFGRVVAVNTFIIRGGGGTGPSLEGLNFSLEARYVHELLTDKGKSYDKEGIAGIIAPSGGDETKSASDRVRRRAMDGYQLYAGTLEESVRVMRAPPGGRPYVNMFFQPGTTYAIMGILQPQGTEVVIGIADSRGRVLQASRPSSAPELDFEPRTPGTYLVFVANASRDPVTANLLFLRK